MKEGLVMTQNDFNPLTAGNAAIKLWADLVAANREYLTKLEATFREHTERWWDMFRRSR
jgi:hypothetical protein